ncbi:hypothetical protein LSG25_08000 [Paralcaligenes sp. KSB-10]|uniref:hypothetical protein n=1 Tax=Paralcaligenes sp. KSB-10 TaxID=2901142 RepID=UPI001E41B8E2|nr:hypothetical protein [Paralcaligenes sp. KSB-10]UHL65802.1 hypothetical protein LSG25_08000 [Paralcaligenes sp. KSB-10]
MSYFKIPALAKFAVLTVVFALQGAAMAAPSDAPASATQSVAPASASQTVPRATKRHHEKKGMALVVPGFGTVKHKVVNSLKLNDSQMKLLADAQAAQDAFQKSLHDLKRTARQEQKAQLDTGKIDPHAAQKAADDMWKKDMGASRDQLTQKWLAVWDALDGAQQQKVTAYLKEKADKHTGHRKD